MSVGELVTSLQAMEQRQNTRKEVGGNKEKQIDIALVVTERSKY